VLLLQEFDLEIWDKACCENLVVGHLSPLSHEATPLEEFPIEDSFTDDQLLAISH